MLKFCFFIGLGLIAGVSFAKPCTITHRSCLILKNHYSQFAKIKCNWLSEVTSKGNSQGSSQLDLAYGDGLGAPEPRELFCTLNMGQITRIFNFYNPYWGSFIEFDLFSEQQLGVHITDGWSSKESRYSFKW